MSQPHSIGFSPCPNDTFIFYALVHGKVDLAGERFAKPFLEDVETLNLWALADRLDVTKLSCHALGHVLDEYCLLSAGAALGRGCGPLLVAAEKIDNDTLETATIAIPGEYTTAALLLKMFLPGRTNLVEMRFDHIMDAVRKGQVAAGVIIHESRFTYQEQGLVCLQDLGQWWEDSSGQPIPLGVIAARRRLGKHVIDRIETAIHDSVAFAFAQPEQCMGYIRAHSQELDAQVVKNHIELYVNDYSVNIGRDGLLALETFLEQGRKAGALPQTKRSLQI